MVESKPEQWMFNLALWALLGVVLGLAIYGIMGALAPAQPAQPTLPPAKPVQNTTPTPPAVVLSNVTVYEITTPNCTACNASTYLADSLVQAASTFKFNVAKKVLSQSSTEAQAFITKYKITKLPTLVVTPSAGSSSDFETAWVGKLGTKETDGYYVYRKVYPPYLDLSLGKPVGYVDTYQIDPLNCTSCSNITPFLDFLKGNQVLMQINSSTFLKQNDTMAQQLITKYNITKLPLVILSPDAQLYPLVNYTWNDSGTIESDGWMVYRNVLPPYLDVKTGKVAGIVDLVELVDSSCTECYNVSYHRNMLEQTFFFEFGNVSRYDINSTQGKALVSKYNITAVPTVLLSNDSLEYGNFETIWDEAGNTVESDGWLVYRALNTMSGKYMNLTSGNVTG